jgi:hypothetical protein
MVADIISWTARAASPGDRTVVLRRPRSGHSSGKSEGERANFGSEEAFRDHADWMRRASRVLNEDGCAGRGVERSFGGWFGSADGGEDRNLSGRLGRRRHGSRNTGMAAGVKPRSREAVRVSAQGFTRDGSPGEDECGVLGGWVGRGWVVGSPCFCSVHMQP